MGSEAFYACERLGVTAKLGFHTHSIPNKGMEPTVYSLRCAPASGSGSHLALAAVQHMAAPMLKVLVKQNGPEVGEEMAR
jgi:hypothetical protein